MEYTQVFLVAMGLLGVLLHNLIKMDSLNRKANGQFKLIPYLMIERFSILISIGVVIGSAAASHEVKQLEAAGNYLALGFIAIGYLAQSILVSFMGKAQKKLESKD